MKFLYLLVAVLTGLSCNKSNGLGQKEEIQQIYEDLVSRLLQDDLWSTRDCYDSGHLLMLPLHYAFLVDDTVMISSFGNHFDRFNLYLKKNKDEFNKYSYLDKVHYWYLTTWYYALQNDISKINIDLLDYIEEEVTKKYRFYNGNWSEMKSYIHNMPENFDFIISKEEKQYKHLRAIVDIHSFTLAIFANIAVTKRKLQLPLDELLYNEVENYTYNLFLSEVVWNDQGGWVLQPGIWRDHPDFRFAGSVDNNPKPCMIDDIGEDISHFFRYPLFLKSFNNATLQVDKKSYYNSLIDGLCTQLNKVCVVKPTESCPYYRFKNYMSGCNGWFRYNDKTGTGYGPYKLSSSLTIGWYAFLGQNKDLHRMYTYTYGKMPFDSMGKSIYNESVTTRKRNPVFIMMEYRKLLCGLASRMTQ